MPSLFTSFQTRPLMVWYGGRTSPTSPPWCIAVPSGSSSIQSYLVMSSPAHMLLSFSTSSVVFLLPSPSFTQVDRMTWPLFWRSMGSLLLLVSSSSFCWDTM